VYIVSSKNEIAVFDIRGITHKFTDGSIRWLCVVLIISADICANIRSRKTLIRLWGSASLTTRHPLYPLKLALTSPTNGVRSVRIVRSRTHNTEFVYLLVSLLTSLSSAFSLFHENYLLKFLLTNSKLPALSAGCCYAKLYSKQHTLHFCFL
jgi:hypothetical protein